ncbi:MAG: hypothetical protein HZA54_17690 [Planctomycetes bacterium]|nr:hypothetical protein [Planctomycetota bacterium]
MSEHRVRRDGRGAGWGFLVAAVALALGLASCTMFRTREHMRKHVQLHFSGPGHVIYLDGAAIDEVRFAGEGLGARQVHTGVDYVEVDVTGAGTIVWAKNTIEVWPEEVVVNGEALGLVTALLKDDGELLNEYIKTWEP